VKTREHHPPQSDLHQGSTERRWCKQCLVSGYRIHCSMVDGHGDPACAMHAALAAQSAPDSGPDSGAPRAPGANPTPAAAPITLAAASGFLEKRSDERDLDFLARWHELQDQLQDQQRPERRLGEDDQEFRARWDKWRNTPPTRRSDEDDREYLTRCRERQDQQPDPTDVTSTARPIARRSIADENDARVARSKLSDPSKYPHMTARQVAAALGISIKTVYDHSELEEFPTGTRKRLWTTVSVIAVKNSPPK